LVKNCRELEKSEHLKDFELKNGTRFTNMIKNARISSNLMISSLNDMKDWNLLKNNKFSKVSQKFIFPDFLAEIYEMMNFKAVIKSLKLELKIHDKIPKEVIGDK
jgi:hypothetical protein